MPLIRVHPLQTSAKERAIKKHTLQNICEGFCVVLFSLSAGVGISRCTAWGTEGAAVRNEKRAQPVLQLHVQCFSREVTHSACATVQVHNLW